MPFTPADDPLTPDINENLVAEVRLEIGDQTEPYLFADQDIQLKLDQRAGNVLLATADLCDILARRFALEYDFETDQQKFARSQRSKQYAALAKDLRTRAQGGVVSIATRKVDGYSQDLTSEDMTTSATPGGGGRVRQGYYSPDIPS